MFGLSIVKKIGENGVDLCFPKLKLTSSIYPQLKDIQFAVIQEWRSWEMFLFKLWIFSKNNSNWLIDY